MNNPYTKRVYQVWTIVRGETQIIMRNIETLQEAKNQAKLFANSWVTSTNWEETSHYLKEE